MKDQWCNGLHYRLLIWRSWVLIPARPPFLFFSTKMITFVLCNIFERIWYSEFILIVKSWSCTSTFEKKLACALKKSCSKISHSNLERQALFHKYGSYSPHSFTRGIWFTFLLKLVMELHIWKNSKLACALEKKLL